MEERIGILQGWFDLEKEGTLEGFGNVITDSWEIVKEELERLRRKEKDGSA